MYPDKKGLKIGGTSKDTEAPYIEHFAANGDKRNGAAILICPGGGYGHLAVGHEGSDVAKFFNNEGFDAIVLHYRLNDAAQSGSRYPDQYNDVTAAMRIVKSKAAGWKVNPDKIGVIGFSAGGHLASMLTTIHKAANPGSKDSLEQYSSRPAFSILVYPVITLEGEFKHAGSARNLLGDNPPADLVYKLSTQHSVDANTPPTLLIHSTDDKTVPVENSLLFYNALKANKIPASLHIFDHGGHGYGMAPKDPVINTWPGVAVLWVREKLGL
ncbi:alpha/beta hydrolase [Chitinophaga sedimenti]|uniref:alpha/beta hydrolase n=1 Tax=Chitinophaga sedimenti TaxID=2033606 RepID=UPI002003AD16|nr:alpha/beta hydrolase [Chitinophaga sedimenti]MCK7558703.1 alpha/beta hydrolase [Chitinophaga sedimenti]